MGKIAIVTDSNSGITQRQAAELGISVVPMPFDIDGKTYYEDISLTQEEFYIKLNGNAAIGAVSLGSFPVKNDRVAYFISF